MKIAAIIPAYNSAHFLRDCLDSILQQTYPLAEIVVVDDGSSDNTREVVAAYPPPVRYVRRPNGGLSAARNTGVKESESPWIAFLDADDRWAPNKIELQVRALEGNPQAVLCYTSTLLVRAGETSVDHADPPSRLWPLLRYTNPITPSTVLIRRDVLEQVGGFDEQLRACEDWDLWVRLGPALIAVAVDEPVTIYRVSPNSLSTNIDRMLLSVSRMLETSLAQGLSGTELWKWRRRAWSAELSRCAITAREAGDPRAIGLLLRSLAAWPSPWFVPRRWKSLLAYLIRPRAPNRDTTLADQGK